jgi:nitrile hydratase subunit alpha
VELFQRWLVAADSVDVSSDAVAGSVYEALHVVLKGLLISKGVLTQAEIDAHVADAATTTANAAALGGCLVAAAWSDAAFKARLLEDAGAACAELGISTKGIAKLVALENTDEVHNLVVCTLCSCYPRTLLGPPPGWYKSWEYRSMAMREPRRCLAGFGVQLPAKTRVVVSDSTADLRYIVIPRRPAGTDGWSPSDLARLVTVESLVGVAVLQPP